MSQPGVNAVDFHSATATPQLRKLVLGREQDNGGVQRRVIVQDVKGSLDRELNEVVMTHCDAERVKVDATSTRRTLVMR